MPNERVILSEAVTTTTLATPRINAAIIGAAMPSKPFKTRVDKLNLAIALTADVLDKLTLTRTRLGWHDRRDAE